MRAKVTRHEEVPEETKKCSSPVLVEGLQDSGFVSRQEIINQKQDRTQVHAGSGYKIDPIGHEENGSDLSM